MILGRRLCVWERPRLRRWTRDGADTGCFTLASRVSVLGMAVRSGGMWWSGAEAEIFWGGSGESEGWLGIDEEEEVCCESEDCLVMAC